jgi:cation diffusion facilitator CzcD-associated flavoprotein CzcO
MPEAVEVAVVGAGHAGLALSHELSQAGVEHLVLERGAVGETWRRRWDSFCLVTPNWTLQLPDGRYANDDPDGFMPRDDIVAHLVGYAQIFRAPVREGVDVSRLRADDGNGFGLSTSNGDMRAQQVVLASGAYQKPYRPACAAMLPASVHALDAEDYTNPDGLPAGKVLVVGSGQTGCQLAEELLEAGRDVFLACGRAPWAPRRVAGRDIVAWVSETPFLEATLADLPSPLARLGANIQATGRHGGHDLHYRTLQAGGVTLLGHVTGIEDGVAYFAPDLAESVAFGDARYTDISELVRTTCAARGTPAPEFPPPPPFDADPPERVDLRDLGSVIFTSGFRPDYTSWVDFPDAFDDLGFPIQSDGSSTVVPGLHFMGVHFQRKRKSATLLGAAEDAAVLAETVARRTGSK